MASRHYTRYDTTVCPDRDECARTYHLQLFEGDCCECCGAVIVEETTGEHGDRGNPPGVHDFYRWTVQ